jgi:hypothetical protein
MGMILESDFFRPRKIFQITRKSAARSESYYKGRYLLFKSVAHENFWNLVIFFKWGGGVVWGT